MSAAVVQEGPVRQSTGVSHRGTRSGGWWEWELKHLQSNVVADVRARGSCTRLLLGKTASRGCPLEASKSVYQAQLSGHRCGQCSRVTPGTRTLVSPSPFECGLDVLLPNSMGTGCHFSNWAIGGCDSCLAGGLSPCLSKFTAPFEHGRRTRGPPLAGGGFVQAS